MSRLPRKSCAALGASFILSLVVLTGCTTLTPTPATSAIKVTGNWQIQSTAAAASRLASLSGELTGSNAAMTGIFHADASTACVPPSTAIGVSGAADANSLVTLTGANLAGGTLTINGTLSSDGKSLTNASYMVAGGTCAFTAAAASTMVAYSSITGTYAGGFSDPGGNVISITANLTQTPSSDTTGNFQLSGTGSFPNNPCFSSPVSVSNTQVTGGSFTLTYADPVTNNSVAATGTFSTDGTTLTVTNWTLTGSCGPDAGTGMLTKQ
jgi:hypothetical protein